MKDLLELVAPCLPSELVPPETVEYYAALATQWLGFAAAGFECQLARDDRTVDMQLGATVADGGMRSLADYVSSTDSSSGGWQALSSFSKSLSTAGTLLNEGVAEVWLEFDHPSGHQVPLEDNTSALPSVFAVLRPAGRDGSLRVAQAVLARLSGELDVGVTESVLERLSQACPSPARISHVGMMLGRPVPAVRVHVSQLPLETFPSFLADVAWGGDIDAVGFLARELLAYGDDVVLCFDVVDSLLPRVGIECAFSQRRGLDPRWGPLLSRLVGLGLAATEKAEALLSWPGAVVPTDPGVTWPEDLIIASLARPADVFGVIERRLSHVKVTWSAGSPVNAKAYFGFGHVWSKTIRSGAAPVQPAPRWAEPWPDPQEAVAAGVDFLVDRRNQGGWWRDFFDRARPAGIDERITGYASDEWVTAYVAAALSTVDNPRALAVARHGLELLLARRADEPAWGYHALLPPDADTTAWVLRLARNLGVTDSERLPAAQTFVKGLIGANGGVATYEPSAASQLCEFLRMEGSYVGWCSAHTCVTAAVAALDIHPGPLNYLLAVQRQDGSWAGHWWDDDEYATARSVEALIAKGEDASAVEGALGWTLGRFGANGSVRASAFATALAIQAALAGTPPGEAEPAEVRRAARWLVSQQLEDGSWAASARLRVPPPDCVDPLASPETTVSYVDNDALFTTATVVAALAAFASRRTSEA